MCELFGISSAEKTIVNPLLREFFSHSVRHPHGWGMAIFYGNSASLEKEPIPAYQSAYLRERLRHRVEMRNGICHIRMATHGNMEYENCHPFVMRDNYDRTWTLAHNGTIFDSPLLDKYSYTQEGGTDSERILCGIVDAINQRQEELGRALKAEERFALLDQFVLAVAPHNKLNLLIYDSELLYVHTNMAGTLYVKKEPQRSIFATVPLDKGSWKPMDFMTLCAYKDGREIFHGTRHENEYFDDPKNYRYLFTDFAEL